MIVLRKFIVLLFLIVCVLACKTQQSADKNQAKTELNSVEVNGYSLNYLEEGNGSPVVFIHGGVGDYRAWVPRMDTYSNDYKVITYSRRYAYPNKQEYDTLADFSQVIHAKDLNTLINKLNLTDVNLVGHSYGALTALAAAIENPERISSLVLGEPPAASLLTDNQIGRDGWQAMMEDYIRPSAQAFRENENEKGIERFLQGVMGDEFRLNQVPLEVKQAWMDNLLEVWGQNINESSEPLDEEKIKALQVPVLLLYGENSPMYFREIIKELEILLPNSETVLIENSSHGLYFENPESCDKVILEFLERN